MTVDTHPMCEERDCSHAATHVVVWRHWSARLCQEHHRKATNPPADDMLYEGLFKPKE